MKLWFHCVPCWSVYTLHIVAFLIFTLIWNMVLSGRRFACFKYWQAHSKLIWMWYMFKTLFSICFILIIIRDVKHAHNHHYCLWLLFNLVCFIIRFLVRLKIFFNYACQNTFGQFLFANVNCPTCCLAKNDNINTKL